MLRKKSEAAYFLVDVNTIPVEHRMEVLEDASMGGADTGLRIVEEIHNGPARAPIYGVYHFDKEKWDATKAELGIEDVEVDEEALVDEAAAKADGEAAAVQAEEDAALRRAGVDPAAEPTNKARRG